MYDVNPIGTSWSLASFASHGMLEKFVDQVHLWNSMEDLSEIRVRRLPERSTPQLALAGCHTRGLGLLVESLGGCLVSSNAQEIESGAESALTTCDWP